MARDIFRELQQYLDRLSLGFPAAASGVEIQILKRLFSEEDAALFLSMTPRLEAPAEIAARVDRPVDEVAAHLHDMTERGLLFRVQKEGGARYGTIPFAHGIFEFQVGRLDVELARLLDAYFHEAFRTAMVRSASTFLRTVPVQEALDVRQNIAAYEDAVGILRRTEKIVVAECICRKQRRLVDQGCGKPREVCFMFGSMGQYYLDQGLGRRVDADEAVRILTEAQEAGLVTQPATAQNPGGMCNCCGDCCGVLVGLNALEKPAEMVFSNHAAAFDETLCNGCEACLDRCQMAAIRWAGDRVAGIDLDRCIGCGLCVTHCPTKALRLVPKAEPRVPPQSTSDQMLAMARHRGLVS